MRNQSTRMLEGWKGGANVGFALTRGNSETKNLALAFTADRKTLHDHLALYTNSVYASTTHRARRRPPLPTPCRAEFATIMIFTPGCSPTWELISKPIALQTLESSLRLWRRPGFARLLQNPKTTLDLLGGINYTREK